MKGRFQRLPPRTTRTWGVQSSGSLPSSVPLPHSPHQCHLICGCPSGCPAATLPPGPGRGGVLEAGRSQSDYKGRDNHERERRAPARVPQRVNSRATQRMDEGEADRNPAPERGEEHHLPPFLFASGGSFTFQSKPGTNESSWERAPPQAADEKPSPRL